MKKTMIGILTIIFFLAGTGLVFAQMRHHDQDMPQSGMSRMHPSEDQMEWFCPWCGSQENSSINRSRMMRHGWCRGQCPRDKAQNMAPMGKDDAKMLLENYVSANPNLKAGNITEKDDVYVGEIVTKDGSLVEKLEINKKTGWMRRGY